MTVLIVSNILLWVLVLLLGAIALVLARQVGILYERVAPAGALVLDKGPSVGDAAPRLTFTDLAGAEQHVGFPRARNQLVFFLSPTCPVCKRLLPTLKSVAHREAGSVDVLLASDGEIGEQRAFVVRERLTTFPYVLSTELGMRFAISRLPYAVLIDREGRIRAKGLVNSREQIESLFTAYELGVGSAQEWLEKMGVAAHPERDAEESHHELVR